MHMFRRNGMNSPFDDDEYADLYNNYGMRPMTESSGDGMGDGSLGGSFRGYGDDDRGTRRRTLGAGLSALGVGLLDSAGTGDWTGGLARGMAGFAEATDREKEQARRDRIEREEMERRQQAENRAAEQERDRNESHDIATRRSTSEFDAWQQDRDRDEQRRAQVGKSAQQKATEIESLAAQNPNDAKLQAMAKRVSGYVLGDDSDLDKLDRLYDDVLTRAYQDEDYDRQTKAGIRRTKEEIAAGVAADPKAAERRANEQLAISRGHLDVDRERSQREASRPTPLQVYDRLERRVAEKLEAKVTAYRENRGMEPMPGLVEQWRQEAIREARTEFESSMGTVMEYTATGELIPR